MKKLFAALALFAASQANAGVVSYNLQDIGTFTDYVNSNTADTYTGTGFVGMYSSGFAHLLGVETNEYSRTLMQVDISALSGKSINSATLSFDLLDGSGGSQAGTLVGFNGGSGVLAYSWDAPASNYGSQQITLNSGANSLDVTSLLAAAIGNNDSWFDMHLTGSSQYQWTYTTYYRDSNAANMYLTVDFNDGNTGNVPEPASLLLLGVGAAALGASRRKRA